MTCIEGMGCSRRTSMYTTPRRLHRGNTETVRGLKLERSACGGCQVKLYLSGSVLDAENCVYGLLNCPPIVTVQQPRPTARRDCNAASAAGRSIFLWRYVGSALS